MGLNAIAFSQLCVMNIRLKYILIILLVGNFAITAMYLFDMNSIVCEPCSPDEKCPPCATEFMQNVKRYYLIWNLVLILILSLLQLKRTKQNKPKYEYSSALASQLTTLINEVKKNISSESDMTYCYYNTPTELIAILNKFISEIENGNLNVIDDLAVEFAPTSSLQEHSMGNGWSDEYLIIAEEFDSIERIARK